MITTTTEHELQVVFIYRSFFIQIYVKLVLSRFLYVNLGLRIHTTKCETVLIIQCCVVLSHVIV